MTTEHEWLELIACHLTNRVEDLVRSPLPPEIAKLLTQLLAAGTSNPDPVIHTQDSLKARWAVTHQRPQKMALCASCQELSLANSETSFAWATTKTGNNTQNSGLFLIWISAGF